MTQSKTSDLKNGCGKKFIYKKNKTNDDGTLSDKPLKLVCCKGFLCPICQALLSQKREFMKVIDESLDSKKSKILIDKEIERQRLPKEYVFQEKYFYLMIDKIKEELKSKLEMK